MKKALLALGYVLLFLFLLSSCDRSKLDLSQGKISTFSAEDMPYDDGAGVVLKWKPLHKSNRVIQYNIYRGVSPDSLFHVGTIDVDPKMGVLAPELFYYDRGDNPLIEFESSPNFIKKEKQQEANSPLYARVPQDPKLLASFIGRYNIFGGIKNDKLYKKAKPILDGDNILTAIKMYQFEYIFATPMPGQEYYYTVLGVNERGKLLPAAEIAKVIPQDDVPQDNAVLFSTYVTDTKVLNYEWVPSVSSQDIAVWEGWLMPKAMLDAANQTLPANWQASAMQLFQVPNYYGTGTMYHQFDSQAEGVALPSNMDSYVPVLAYGDYSGQYAAVKAKNFRLIEASALPKMPAFAVEDKKNDKGDNLIVSIGKPAAFMVSASFTNHAKKAIKFNYELAENENYKTDKLKFSLFTPDGKLINSKEEFYIDKNIIVKLPKEHQGIQNLKLKIESKISKATDYEPIFTEQIVSYDPVNKLFKGEGLYLDGEKVSKQYFDILTKGKLDPAFVFGNRTNAITRAYDHNIPYEDVLFQTITGYHAPSKQLLLEPQFMVDADNDNGLSFVMPLFRDKFAKDMADSKKNIDELKAAISAYPQGNAPDSLTSELEYAEANYNFIVNHPAYQQAEKAKNSRKWFKTLNSERQKNKRSYAYKLLKTDGNGAFVISDEYVDGKNKAWFFPKSEIFDDTKLITFFATMLFCILLVYAIYHTRRREVYIRPIAGLHEIDNAIGRATEMGRPIMFVPGWGTLGDVCTIASMMILSQIAKKAAEFDIRMISPHCDYLVLPMAQEIVQSAFSEVGRSDAFNQNDIFFVSNDQFPFCAGVNGITVRERVATVFYMGYFNAEALLLTETGNQAGSIQIAATDAITQIPFFITTCDYTLIGEEFYAASAYLSRNPELVSMLKAQDYFKLVMVVLMVVGTILSTFKVTSFIGIFPVE